MPNRKFKVPRWVLAERLETGSNYAFLAPLLGRAWHIQTSSVDALGKGEKKGGAQQCQKLRLETLERVR